MSHQNLSNNSKGAGRYGSSSILSQYPDLGDILQSYINAGVKEKDLPKKLMRDHNIKMALRTVQKYKLVLGVVTARRSGLSNEQKASAIDALEEQDPIASWGSELVKEKLAHKGLHIPREHIRVYRKEKSPENAAARHPASREKHSHGLWSIGPNEEWGIDGHEKILKSMGIAIYGVIDKFSRMELALWAMSNARVSDVPVVVLLRLIQEKKGMPLSITSDKGTELGKAIPLITTLRAKYQPFLSEVEIPSFKAVTSTSNITRERAWSPLWHKELANIECFYSSGKITSGYREFDRVHFTVARWLWGTIVQTRLDQILKESQYHKIRKQKKILLPSGARRIDLYENPETYGAGLQDRLIEIPEEDLKVLLAKYDDHALFRFGSEHDVNVCKRLHLAIGAPAFLPMHGWNIFKDMIEFYISSECSDFSEAL